MCATVSAHALGRSCAPYGALGALHEACKCDFAVIPPSYIYTYLHTYVDMRGWWRTHARTRTTLSSFNRPNQTTQRLYPPHTYTYMHIYICMHV